MLTTILATATVTALTFAATVSHVKSESADTQVSVSELWKIRAYQEDDARAKSAKEQLDAQNSSEKD